MSVSSAPTPTHTHTNLHTTTKDLSNLKLDTTNLPNSNANAKNQGTHHLVNGSDKEASINEERQSYQYQVEAQHSTSTSTTMNYSPTSSDGTASGQSIGMVVVDGEVTYLKPTTTRLPSDSAYFTDLKIHDNDIPSSPTDSDIQRMESNSSANGIALGGRVSSGGSSTTSGSNGDNSDESHRKHECIQSPESRYHLDCELPADLKKQIQDARPLIKQFRLAIEEYADKHPDSLYVSNALVDDEFVYRFLVARSKNINKSVDMFKQACDYRELHDIDHILDRPLPNGYEIMQAAQQAVHNFDSQGRPVLIERVGSQHAREMYEKYGFEGRCYYHQYLMEYLVRHVMPEASRRAGKKVTQVVIVIDLKGLHMGQVFKTNYSFVKYVTKCNSLQYPEYLHTTFVIGIPRIFSFVWNIVKGWIDEKTRNKIAIIHGNGLSEATKLIEKKNYPRIFGGDCKCTACTTGDGSKLYLSPETQEFTKYMNEVNSRFPAHMMTGFDNKLSADMLTRVKTGN